MNSYWQYIAIGLFFVMIFSPVWFFSKLDKYLFSEEGSIAHTSPVNFISPLTIVPNIDDETRMDLNTKRLAANEKAYKNSVSPEMKQIWMIKGLELHREIKWKTLQISTKSGF